MQVLMLDGFKVKSAIIIPSHSYGIPLFRNVFGNLKSRCFIHYFFAIHVNDNVLGFASTESGFGEGFEGWSVVGH